MLFMLNLTGLERVHWLPWWKFQTDHDGLWYFDIKWLGVQFIVYSREMGNALSDLIARLKQAKEGNDVEDREGKKEYE